MVARFGGGSRTDTLRVAWKQFFRPSYELVAADSVYTSDFSRNISELGKTLDDRGENHSFNYRVREPTLLEIRGHNVTRGEDITLAELAGVLDGYGITTGNTYTLWRNGKDVLELHGHAGRQNDARVLYRGYMDTSLSDFELGEYFSLQD